MKHPASMKDWVALSPGDPAPWFHQRTSANPKYAFDSAAGRWIVLCFFGSARGAPERAAIADVIANRHLFDDVRACFFGVSLDPSDEAERRVTYSLPGLRYFWDFDGRVARLYGSIPKSAKEPFSPTSVFRFWAIIDPMLRVHRILPFRPNGAERRELFAEVAALPPPGQLAGVEITPPVLILPNVFEPDFCRQLIGLYEAHGGEESGFVREEAGKTVLVHDHEHKRRKDYVIEDEKIVRQTQARIQRRVVPEILKAHQFKITRMERYIVSCYSAEDGGHFRPHRDNTTKGTAHRRFAVSINLNDDFDGGELCFPEYGPRGIKIPRGAAVVFSCSLLHAATRVTRGERYAFLPFLYDDAAAKIREANNSFLDDQIAAYRQDHRQS